MPTINTVKQSEKSYTFVPLLIQSNTILKKCSRLCSYFVITEHFPLCTTVSHESCSNEDGR